MRRFIARAYQALQYLLLALEHPALALEVLRLLLTERSYLREWLRLQEAAWLRQAGIRTVLDVGAYKGSFSYGVMRTLPQAHIYAFEPLPDHFAALKKLEGRARLKAFPVALGNAQGETSFHRSAFSASSSVLVMSAAHREAFPETAGGEEVRVALGRLDDYAAELALERPALLKVDVQGYELEVLKGALETLKAVDYALVEISLAPLYEGQPSFDAIYAFMDAQGFEYAGDFDQLLSRQDGRVLQVDAIFVRRGP